MNSTKNASFSLVLIATAMIAASGCGSKSNQTNNPQQPPGGADGCPAGQYRDVNTGQCVGTPQYGGGASFEQCVNTPGRNIRTKYINGQQMQICRYAQSYGGISLARGNYYWLPLLTPEQPSSPTAINTGIPVRRGDRISVSATGSWGYFETRYYSRWHGLLNYSRTRGSCYDIDLDGYSGSRQIYNGNVPAGLVISDGAQVYFVGTGQSYYYNGYNSDYSSTYNSGYGNSGNSYNNGYGNNGYNYNNGGYGDYDDDYSYYGGRSGFGHAVTINNDGILFIGLNVPGETQWGCTTGRVNRLSVIRCVAQNGAPCI